jgi:hypothetical protein
MTTHKSRHLAIGENISERQRLTEQLTERQALAYVPSEAGKYWLQIDYRTKILVPIGTNEEEKISSWRDEHV